jgi:hypothetical protein
MSKHEHDMDQPHVRNASAAHDGEDSGAVDPGMRRMFGMLGVRTPERTKRARAAKGAAPQREELARVGALMPGLAADPLAAGRRSKASVMSDPLAVPRVALASEREEEPEGEQEDGGQPESEDDSEEEPEAARRAPTLEALAVERSEEQRRYMRALQRLHARRRELVTRSRSALAARPGRVAHRTR